jgi:hypothetical protein
MKSCVILSDNYTGIFVYKLNKKKMTNSYQTVNQFLEYPLYPTNYEFYYTTQKTLNSSIGIMNIEVLAKEVNEQYLEESQNPLKK